MIVNSKVNNLIMFYLKSCNNSDLIIETKDKNLTYRENKCISWKKECYSYNLHKGI